MIMFMKDDPELTKKVLRGGATEAPGTGALLHNKDDGSYLCAGCGSKLFSSDTKFDSGSGWPSFDNAVEGAVKTKRDFSHGMIRTEAKCAQCDGHLGHVFKDGPRETTGERYCINSAALDFKKKSQSDSP